MSDLSDYRKMVEREHYALAARIRTLEAALGALVRAPDAGTYYDGDWGASICVYCEGGSSTTIEDHTGPTCPIVQARALVPSEELRALQARVDSLAPPKA